MKLIPKYSFDFNIVLNEGFTETEQIRNFGSLLSDKDRFLSLIPLLVKNENLIEDRLGFKLKDEIEFFVVRAEKFKSFSEPITIEYSLLPQEMFLFLLKEIIKNTITIRFPDIETQEKYVNSFVDYLSINGDWDKVDFVKFCRNIHDDSLNRIKTYKMDDIDFSKKTMRDYLEEMYNS